jgi:hypothetical protein
MHRYGPILKCTFFLEEEGIAQMPVFDKEGNMLTEEQVNQRVRKVYGEGMKKHDFFRPGKKLDTI